MGTYTWKNKNYIKGTWKNGKLKKVYSRRRVGKTALINEF